MKNNTLENFSTCFYDSLKMVSKLRCSKRHLLSYEELPAHLLLMHDNPYIRKGYHPPTKTWQESWGLLWSVHSETLNIWSHMIGSVLFLVFLLKDLNDGLETDYWITLIYDLGSFFTFTFSALYHWFHIQSETHHNTCLCLDHLGIEIKIFVDSIKFMHRLVGDEKLFNSYVIIQSFGFAIAMMLLYKCLTSMKYGKIMNSSFGPTARLLLLASHVVILNTSLYHYFDEANGAIIYTGHDHLIALMYTEVSLAISISIYVLKFPESIWPGKFDTYFNSHQIMHVATLFTAIYVRYYS